MSTYWSTEELKQLLQLLGISPQKTLGQHFLISPHLIDRILEIADVGLTDNVLEIGGGPGILSIPLAERARRLTVLELDKSCCAHLGRYLPPERTQIIHGDARQFDFAAYAADAGWVQYKLVANLPYYITAEILAILLTEGGPWSTLTLMMQKEVALKLTNSNVRSPLALRLAYLAEAAYALRVPAEAFWPEPSVESAVLQIKRRRRPAVEVNDEDSFFRFIALGFEQRRKTLVNNLDAALGGGKERWRGLLKELNIHPDIRAENLDLAQFAAVYNAVES